MAKAAGNGHPVGFVVTTSKVCLAPVDCTFSVSFCGFLERVLTLSSCFDSCFASFFQLSTFV
jgi:hypothetical protein